MILTLPRLLIASSIPLLPFADATMHPAGATVDAEARRTALKGEWTPEIDTALEAAATDSKIVLLALGEVGEARSERHLKDLYRSKATTPYLEQTLNVAAWSFAPDERDDAPQFDGMVPGQHIGNHDTITSRWVTPNESGVIALPQHVWLSSDGEVLLSCPFEISADEFAWCSNEALRLAGVEERPELSEGAHPPRRLLLGQTFRTLDADTLGRGLEPKALAVLIKKLNKQFLTMGDREAVTQILFTDEDDAPDFIGKQLGLWDMGGAGTAGIVDGTIGLIGTISPSRFLEILEDQASNSSASRRRQVAAAIENLGDPEALGAVKKVWKKEKDEATRADWARALGASGRANKSVAKLLLRAAQKDKSERVRRSAILGLGHVLPEPSALTFLTETARKGGGLEREAAILALGLGRALGAREALVEVQGDSLEDTTKAALDAAIAVLDGGNLYLLEENVARVSESSTPRARLFFRATATAAARNGGGARRR